LKENKITSSKERTKEKVVSLSPYSMQSVPN
jgi:hypothetical protein